VNTKQQRPQGKNADELTRIQKEDRHGSRYTVSVGEDFTDLKQPSERELLLGKLKKGLKWAGSVALNALITALVTALVAVLLAKLIGG